MSATIVGGVFGITGVILGVALSWAQQRVAAKSAAKGVASALFTQAVKAITVMHTERELFRQRREGLRPNLIAVANVAVQLLAAKVATGTFANGMAGGLGGMTAWDASEGARFADRYVAARAEVTTALVQLSLMSDALQDACSGLSDVLADLGKGEKAAAEINKAVAVLRAAVCAYRG